MENKTIAEKRYSDAAFDTRLLSLGTRKQYLSLSVILSSFPSKTTPYMHSLKLPLSFLFLVLLSFSLSAQQKSKTKAANKLYEKGNDVELLNTTKINTANLEFSPTYYLNGIVYASSRFTQGERDDKIDETFFELFYAELDANGIPVRPKEFSVEVNSPLHEGPVTFSRQGQVMYFTRNNLKKGIRKADEEGVTRLKIYEAQKGAVDWKDVKECSFNSDEYSTCHPSISADGEELYFSSDMAGGRGGMDLYKVVRNANGSWSQPVNLGPTVNTPQNEVFPFIHSSGHLFFTSNGHGGAGGLDLFMVKTRGSGKQANVVNLGEPFNSEADDLGIIINPDGTNGFFSSDRPGGTGKDDIYRFESANGIWGMTKPSVFSTKIRIQDAASKERLEGAEIRIFERTVDGFVNSGEDLYEAVLMPAEEEGGNITFQLVRKDAESLSKPDRISNRNGEANFDFTGERKFLVLVSKEGYTTREAGFSTQGNEAKEEVIIKLKKRTCATLSGVVKNRTSGGRVPGAVVRIRNQCNNTVETLLTTELGTFNYCLPLGCAYSIEGVKENYLNSQVTISTTANNGSHAMKTELLLVPDDKSTIKKGAVIVLENIYYDFDKSDIRKGAARELDELLERMLAYPSMEIEFLAHTDSRGNDQYNLELSQRRAESAREYLLSRGVEGHRVKAVGMGEIQLRNRCKNGVKCKEEEHEYNRRSEVRVLQMDEPVRIKYEENTPKRN